jgi:hypothetical protein
MDIWSGFVAPVAPQLQPMPEIVPIPRIVTPS